MWRESVFIVTLFAALLIGGFTFGISIPPEKTVIALLAFGGLIVISAMFKAADLFGPFPGVIIFSLVGASIGTFCADSVLIGIALIGGIIGIALVGLFLEARVSR